MVYFSHDFNEITYGCFSILRSLLIEATFFAKIFHSRTFCIGFIHCCKNKGLWKNLNSNIHQEKNFFEWKTFFLDQRNLFVWLKKKFLNQTLNITTRSKNSFFDLKKFFYYFFFFELKKRMYTQSHSTYEMWFAEIFSLIQRKNFLHSRL